MNVEPCQKLSLTDLVDYSVGDLPAPQAAEVEEHLFSCPDCGRRAAELDRLAGGVGRAARAGQVGACVTDAVVNRLSRDGVRVRSYALSPGDNVPCAVWEDDEVMVLRLRGDFTGISEVTLAQRVEGVEVSRASGLTAGGPHGEILYAVSATWVRQLPEAAVELLLSADIGGESRTIGAYTLRHAGRLRREPET
jgi:anti-sigma factor RsiW